MAKKDVIAEQKVGQDDVEKVQYVKSIFDGGNMTNVMGDPKLKDFLTSWQYSLFLTISTDICTIQYVRRPHQHRNNYL